MKKLLIPILAIITTYSCGKKTNDSLNPSISAHGDNNYNKNNNTNGTGGATPETPEQKAAREKKEKFDRDVATKKLEFANATVTILGLSDCIKYVNTDKSREAINNTANNIEISINAIIVSEDQDEEIENSVSAERNTFDSVKLYEIDKIKQVAQNAKNELKRIELEIPKKKKELENATIKMQTDFQNYLGEIPNRNKSISLKDAITPLGQLEIVLNTTSIDLSDPKVSTSLQTEKNNYDTKKTEILKKIDNLKDNYKQLLNSYTLETEEYNGFMRLKNCKYFMTNKINFNNSTIKGNLERIDKSFQQIEQTYISKEDGKNYTILNDKNHLEYKKTLEEYEKLSSSNETLSELLWENIENKNFPNKKQIQTLSAMDEVYLKKIQEYKDKDLRNLFLNFNSTEGLAYILSLPAYSSEKANNLNAIAATNIMIDLRIYASKLSGDDVKNTVPMNLRN